MFDHGRKISRTAVTLASIAGLALGAGSVLAGPAVAEAAPGAAAAVPVNRIKVRATPGIAQVSTTATTAVTATVRGGGSTLPDKQVTFDVDRGFVSETQTPTSTSTQTVTATTDSNGIATVYVGSAVAGVQSIIATSENVTDLATKTYAADPAVVTLEPATASVEAGQAQDFTATVTDGAGSPVTGTTVDFADDGPGVLSDSSATTDADGRASVTLTTAKTDTGSGTVTATVTATELSASSTYELTPVVVGPPTTITVESAVGGQISTTDTTPVTATVTDDDGDLIAGLTVTFSVDLGFVSDAATATGTTTTMTTATTDANGVATAYVGSTAAGSQTITVTAGDATGSTTKDYLANPTTLTLTPTSATFAAGTKQTFTATVTDAVGNPSPNTGVAFSNGDGPGLLNTTNVVTGADGTATVTLTTATDDTGSGTVTATVYVISGNLVETATYTATATVPPTSVASVEPTLGPLAAPDKVQVVTVKVTNGDGTAPAAGTSVDLLVSGASVANGTVVTDASGNARFLFRVQHAGVFTVKAVAGGMSGSTMGTTPLRHVSTTLRVSSSTKGVIAAVASTSPVRPGVKMAFVIDQGSKRVGIVTAITNAQGVASQNLTGLKSGTVYAVTARIYGDPDSDSVNSTRILIRVK